MDRTSTITSPNPVPEGECTCEPDAPEPCAYCYAMMLWAHEELYGPDSFHPDPEYGEEDRRSWDWDDEDEDDGPEAV